MGVESSTLTPDDIEELQAEVGFAASEIKRLYERFQKLDRSKSGAIRKQDFHLIPELSMNPLCDRVLQLFLAEDQFAEKCNFKMFAKTLWVFHAENSLENKIAHVFRCYDQDQDGFISKDDLFGTLKIMVGENMEDDTLRKIAESTVADADTDCDGKLSMAEFAAVMPPDQVQEYMTFDF